MGLYGGIDLHSNNNVLAVISQGGERHYCRRLPNDLRAVEAALEPIAQSWKGSSWSRHSTGTGWSMD